MFPDKETALKELEIAEKMNPGRWTTHCLNAAKIAEAIADNCENLDSEKAYVCGLLHDIGRRTGVCQVRHIIDGYDYCMSKGWDEVARICMTHSYPIQDIDTEIGKLDITEEQYKTIDEFLKSVEYDDYDKLIILCDSLALPDGVCILEKRFIDTSRRYGIFPFTVERWNKTYEFKEHFEKLMGKNLYKLLPDFEESIYF